MIVPCWGFGLPFGADGALGAGLCGALGAGLWGAFVCGGCLGSIQSILIKMF